MKNVILTVVTLLFVFVSSSQKRKINGDTYLIREVENFLQNNDQQVRYGRKIETEILMMEVDSAGKISKIHLFSDEQQRDFTFSILTTLTPSYFGKLTFKDWIGRLVILPIITWSDYLPRSYSGALNRDVFNAYENDHVVFIRPLNWRMYEVSDRNSINKTSGSIADSIASKK